MVLIGGAPEQAGLASERRDVAGGKLEQANQAPSPGPSPQPPSPQPHPKVKTVFYELLMQRKVKTVFSEHVMCVLFCVPFLAARAGKKLVVAMGSQAASYAARALRQEGPH